MDKQDKDIKKELEDLEKLIEQVKEQHELEKQNRKKDNKKPSRNVIRIDLGSKYSSNFWMNIVISYLINFLLMFFINSIFRFFEYDSIYTLLLFVLLYTMFEESYKYYLIKKFLNIVLYSYGMIFFLLNILFLYAMDLYFFANTLSFFNELYPLFFVIILQITRVFIKQIYVRSVHAITLRIAKVKNRK